jgi:hypothetical protein
MINKILCAMFFTRVSEIEVCGIKKVSLIICIFAKLWRFSVNHGLYFNNNFEVTVMI